MRKDKIFHFLVGLSLGITAMEFSSDYRMPIAAALGFGLVKELYDWAYNYVTDAQIHSVELGDLAATTAGGTLYAILVWAANSY